MRRRRKHGDDRFGCQRGPVLFFLIGGTINRADSLFGGSGDCYMSPRKSFLKVISESSCCRCHRVANNETRVMGFGESFREQVVGHFGAHTTQADKAYALCAWVSKNT